MLIFQIEDYEMLQILNPKQGGNMTYIDLQYVTGEKIRCLIDSVEVWGKLYRKLILNDKWFNNNWIRKMPSKQILENPKIYIHDADVFLKL